MAVRPAVPGGRRLVLDLGWLCVRAAMLDGSVFHDEDLSVNGGWTAH